MTGLRWEDLTDKERWRYVNQDFVRGYELLPKRNGLDVSNEDADFWGCVNLENSSKLRKTIINLYKDGKQTEEIAYHVPLSCSQINRILEEHRNELSIKEQILTLYKKGLTKKQIIARLDCTLRYINKIIGENLNA